MLARLDAKASTVELMMQRAEELDHRASDMYNDGDMYNGDMYDNDDDESYGGAPVEVDEYEPVEYQVTTREPSALTQIYGDGATAGVELKPELARGLKLYGVHELVTWTCTDGVGVSPRWAFVTEQAAGVVRPLSVRARGWITHERPPPRSSRPTSRPRLGTGVPTWFDNPPTATEGNVLKALLFSVPRGGDGEPRRGGVARSAGARANDTAGDKKDAADERARRRQGPLRRHGRPRPPETNRRRAVPAGALPAVRGGHGGDGLPHPDVGLDTAGRHQTGVLDEAQPCGRRRIRRRAGRAEETARRRGTRGIDTSSRVGVARGVRS